jgi:tetratricopeptide (TPR) repeat protein
MVLHNLAIIEVLRGDPSIARGLFEEALAVKRELGDKRGIATSLTGLASALRSLGAYDEGLETISEALGLGDQIKDPKVLVNAIEVLAFLYEAIGQPDRAVPMLAASAAARVSMNLFTGPDDQAELDAVIGRLRETLGADAFGSLWTEGEGWDLEEATRQARATT